MIMAPKKKGKVATKKRAGTPPRDTSPPLPREDVSDVDEVPPVLREQPQDTHPREDDEQPNQEPNQKKKRTYNNFTDEQEDNLVNWLKANPILYNKGLREYKMKDKKAAMWTEKALELEIPESYLYIWYKTMRTQFGRLSNRKSGDGTRELTDRDQWILTSFDFLKTHIVRVASRQAGGLKQKLASATATANRETPQSVLDSDESDVQADDDYNVEQEPSRTQRPVRPCVSEESPSTSTAPAAASSAPQQGSAKTKTSCLAPKEKKKKAAGSPELENLIQKLTERVEGNRELRAKVTEMVKAVENPHTAYANFLGSMRPIIHPDLWDEYLQHSFETLMQYVKQSNRLRRAQQDHQVQQHFPQQIQQPMSQQPYQRTYAQLQPMSTQQPQGASPQVCQTGGGGGYPPGPPNTSDDGFWDIPAPNFGRPLTLVSDTSPLIQPSSCQMSLAEISAPQPHGDASDSDI